ncbi:MAG: hypothetical protein H7263_16420 [Candidatus Sericytochromatia bacterium]|nr:hypothetical protein [Candidatus Sericytochromatia bacterium]
MKKIIFIPLLLSFIPAYAQAVDYMSHAKLVAFVFFTGLVFACILGVLLQRFKLNLKYNILIGFISSLFIFWISFEYHNLFFYSINLFVGFLIGWLLSSYLLHKLILPKIENS